MALNETITELGNSIIRLMDSKLSKATGFVKTSENQTISGVKTFNNTIAGDISGNAKTSTEAASIKNYQSNSATKIWVGTALQAGNIEEKDADTTYYETDRATTQYVKPLTTGDIVLTRDCSFYAITVAAATTFAFDTTALGLNSGASESYTFELCITMNTVSALTFPTSVKWCNGEAPDLSKAGTYYFAFRQLCGSGTWHGSLQGRW